MQGVKPIPLLYLAAINSCSFSCCKLARLMGKSRPEHLTPSISMVGFPANSRANPETFHVPIKLFKPIFSNSFMSIPIVFNYSNLFSNYTCYPTKNPSSPSENAKLLIPLSPSVTRAPVALVKLAPAAAQWLPH